MKSFKRLFKKYNIDGYIVPKNDEFFNEYIYPSNDRLKYISNFSGSAGFAILLKVKNYLFVDGRYTTQANYQSGLKFKIITIPKKFPKDVLKFSKKIILGFDPRLHTERNLSFLFKSKKIDLRPIYTNLVDKIWFNKKNYLTKPFFLLPSKIVGLSYNQKIQKVKSILLKKKFDYLFVTAPENIAWLLNIRGHDTSFSPIPNGRLLISKSGEVNFFTNPLKIKKIKKIFNKRLIANDEKKIKDFLKIIKNKHILLDILSCSLFFKNLLARKNKVSEKVDPIHHLKAIKNNTEIKNIKKCHILDGVALTKFLFWVKKNFNKKKLTEISVQKKLENFRKMNKSYKSPSFDTISGSGPNSAIIHYKASMKTNRNLKKGELYLVDSGGQYYFGTTDVTRTISLENKSNYIKNIYTNVLKGHIAVSNFKIKKTTNGSHVDYVARKFLNKNGLDYPHGTGHGVGYFLNVHEGPQSFSRNNKINLKDGMVLSNEPGYYKQGAFGIRIENLIYVKSKRFRQLTWVPLDKDLINEKLLSKNEIKWINIYHGKVKKNLLKFMNFEERKDLVKACLPI